MNRNDDHSTQANLTPAYDEQGNPINQDSLRQEDRDILGQNQEQDDDLM